MKVLLKRVIAFVLVVILLFNLTGCVNTLGVEEYAYVIAIGLDALPDDNIVLTLQFATAGGRRIFWKLYAINKN